MGLVQWPLPSREGPRHGKAHVYLCAWAHPLFHCRPRRKKYQVLKRHWGRIVQYAWIPTLHVNTGRLWVLRAWVLEFSEGLISIETATPERAADPFVWRKGCTHDSGHQDSPATLLWIFHPCLPLRYVLGGSSIFTAKGFWLVFLTFYKCEGSSLKWKGRVMGNWTSGRNNIACEVATEAGNCWVNSVLN